MGMVGSHADEALAVAVPGEVDGGHAPGMRVAQATLNPDFAGMPASASTAEWRMPANCGSWHQR